MAKETVLIDDTDGSPGAVERRFSIGGIEYSIDLIDANWQFFLEQIDVWRRLAKVRTRRQNKAPVISPEDRTKIRAWAKDHGYELADRGRFPNRVVEDYYNNLSAPVIDFLYPPNGVLVNAND